jgi:hypothetical protein
MQKQANVGFRPYQFGNEAYAASRQMWLASLGAAAVTSDWMQTEARRKFKALVKEGTIVESRAVTFVGDQIEGSMNRANLLWKRTRRTVESTVKQAADTAVAIAEKVLPKSLPKVEVNIAAAPAAKAKKPARARKTARPAKRAKKTSAKR